MSNGIVEATATEAMEILLAGCSPSTRDLLALEGIKAVDYLEGEELLCHVDEILSQYHDVARTEADEGTDERLCKLRRTIGPLIEDSLYLHHALLEEPSMKEQFQTIYPGGNAEHPDA